MEMFCIYTVYGTADTLTQEIFNFPARRQTEVKCKSVLTSQQRHPIETQSTRVPTKTQTHQLSKPLSENTQDRNKGTI
jgi:hypothetical protein